MRNCDSIILTLNKEGINYQFMNLKDYYKKVSSIIKNKKNELVEMNDKLQKESEEAQEQHIDDYDYDCYSIKMIEHTFCFSMVISIYTFIEKYLNEICNNLKNCKNILITYEEYLNKKKGSVHCAKTYLEKHCGINFNTNDSEFLSVINAIRNLIAHKNGELYNESKAKVEIIKISKQAPGLKMNQAEIELELDFIEYCFKQVNTVLKNIFEAVLL